MRVYRCVLYGMEEVGHKCVVGPDQDEDLDTTPL